MPRRSVQARARQFATRREQLRFNAWEALIEACNKAVADYTSEMELAMDPTPIEQGLGTPLKGSTVYALRDALGKVKIYEDEITKVVLS